MIQIARILCPVDFTEFSRRALDHAAAIACWYEARVTVLYVFPNRPAMDVPPVTMSAKERERLEATMAAFTRHLPASLSLDLRIEEASDVHLEILAQAAATQADLLVLGSHGRSGFERLRLGSVTERLIRQSPCPTLIVPRLAPDTPPDVAVRYRSILCPVDFSEASKRALTYALMLAEESDARLTVLHAIEVPPELQATASAEEVNVDAVHAEAEAERLRCLRALIPEEAKTYCTVMTTVREGAADRTILNVAAEQQADLIVMGVQGRGALDRLVFGSNTARVARTATCPVLIVRPQ
jgi:nucleotide-binding universal stress UspA family protein